MPDPRATHEREGCGRTRRMPGGNSGLVSDYAKSTAASSGGQRPIGLYIVDFVCLEERVIIEVDGGHHLVTVSRDARRDAYLGSLGFKVLRFWDNEVLNQIGAVLEVIGQAFRARERPPSQPSPAAGGRDSPSLLTDPCCSNISNEKTLLPASGWL